MKHDAIELDENDDNFDKKNDIEKQSKRFETVQLSKFQILFSEICGEFLGSFILVLFGCGSVAAAVNNIS